MTKQVPSGSFDGPSWAMYIWMYMSTRRYSIAQAREELPTIVRAVERGSTVEITRRGEPVAVMMSLEARDRLLARRKTFSEAYDDLLARFGERPTAVKSRYFDELRDTTAGRKVDL